jgi:hypothetical protein
MGVGAVAVALFAACGILALNSLWQAQPKHVVRPALAAAAVVNGETIYNKEVDKMWDNEHPVGEKRNALLAQERARFERSHIRLSHIFFTIAQQNDLISDPSNVVARAKEKAAEAWSRLQRGETFEAVAAEYSEDRVSGPTGGDLGCVPRNAFGREVEEAIRQLKPDEVSQPIVSPWGVHILHRTSLTDADVLSVLRDEYVNRTMDAVLDKIRREAKLERAGEPRN